MTETSQLVLAAVHLAVSLAGCVASILVACLVLDRRGKEAAAREQEALARQDAARAAVEGRLAETQRAVNDVLILVGELRRGSEDAIR